MNILENSKEKSLKKIIEQQKIVIQNLEEKYDFMCEEVLEIIKLIIKNSDILAEGNSSESILHILDSKEIGLLERISEIKRRFN